MVPTPSVGSNRAEGCVTRRLWADFRIMVARGPAVATAAALQAQSHVAQTAGSIDPSRFVPSNLERWKMPLQRRTPFLRPGGRPGIDEHGSSEGRHPVSGGVTFGSLQFPAPRWPE